MKKVVVFIILAMVVFFGLEGASLAASTANSAYTGSACNWASLTTLATPTASLKAGTYNGPQTIRLSGPSGAIIRYTINGKTPSSKSTRYTKPITVTKKTVLKAIAVKSGYANSKVMSASYNIKPIALKAPTASLKAGIYSGTKTVKLSGPAGAKIYYTTNGKTPTTRSTKYSKPIKVSKNTTIKAIAVPAKAGTGYTNSKVLSVKYSIKAPVPSKAYIPNGKTFPLGGGEVTFKAPSGMTIYVKLYCGVDDGSVLSTTTYDKKILPGHKLTVVVKSDIEVQLLLVKKGYTNNFISRLYICRTDKVVPMGDDFCQSVLDGVNWNRWNCNVKSSDGHVYTHTPPAAMDSRLNTICQKWATKLATEDKLYHTGYDIDESICSAQLFTEPEGIGTQLTVHNGNLALPRTTLIGVGAARALDGTIYVVVEGGDEAHVAALAALLGVQ